MTQTIMSHQYRYEPQAPISAVLFLFVLLVFLLTLFQLLRWKCAFCLLSFQLRQFGFHLDDQRLELFLALFTGMGVDVAGVLFAVDPGGRVAALPQVWAFLCDASSAGPALFASNRLEIGHAGLFVLARGSILPRLGTTLRRCRLTDATVDVGRGLPLHIVADVSVDVQRGRRRHMAKHGGECFDIHAALERQRRKCMAQIVEADVRQASLLEQNFQTAIGRVRVHGQLRTDRLREYPLADRPLLPLPQEFHDALGQDDGAVTFAGLGRAQSEHTQLLAVERAAHIERAFLFIEVLPHETADLAPPQSGHELGVKELVPDFVLADEFHEGFQLLFVEDLLRFVVGLGRSGTFSGIAGNDVGLHRVLHSAVEHGVDVVDGGVGEGVALFGMFVDPSVLFQSVVHPLDVVTVDEGNLLAAQLRFDVGFDELTVAGQRGGTDGALLVVLQLGVQPLAQRHAAVLGQLHVTVGCDFHTQLQRIAG